MAYNPSSDRPHQTRRDSSSYQNVNQNLLTPRGRRLSTDGGGLLTAEDKQTGRSKQLTQKVEFKRSNYQEFCVNHQSNEFGNQTNVSSVYLPSTPRRHSIVPTIMVTSPSQPGEFGFRMGTELSLAMNGKLTRKHVRSRGSLPFTPALNIPEPIPEIVLPRRHSVSFQTHAGAMSNEQ
ncbi:hypothetical protein EG68_09732 [Paragonimus skrjabini miyazakii]|uniref:Uncharacterized protein n=1 Tax=Paragonimus skrjabini miyazakii TaxID=59628 RepID=A0A8S9YMT2_9TREM|nr:hypothetical protein EG68_09732 [Paragonimus skrjabini miyazakii]